jgi:hypothetical protein
MRWREAGLTPVYMEAGVVYEVTMYVTSSVMVSLPPSSHPLLAISGIPLGSSLLVTLSASRFSLLTTQDSLSTVTMASY